MAYDESDRKRKTAIKEVWKAIVNLQKTLESVADDYPDDFRISFSKRGGGGSPRKGWYMVEEFEGGEYVITADSKEHAEEHGNELEEQGCFCGSTGATQVTCDCSQA
jgi:hypothetical protein